MHNGTVIARGVRPLTHIMPNDSGTVVIPSVKNTYNRKSGELLLNVYAKYKNEDGLYEPVQGKRGINLNKKDKGE